MTANKEANMKPVDKLGLQPGGWAVLLRAGRNIQFRMEADSSFQDIIVPNGYSANVPCHVSCTYSSGVAKVYIDGVLRTTATSVPQATNPPTAPLRIGIPSIKSIGERFEGTMSHIRVYSRALSDLEVSQIAAEP